MPRMAPVFAGVVASEEDVTERDRSTGCIEKRC